MATVLSLHGFKLSTTRVEEIVNEVMDILSIIRDSAGEPLQEIHIRKLIPKGSWLRFLFFYIMRKSLRIVRTKHVYERIRIMLDQPEEDLRSELLSQCWINMLKCKGIKSNPIGYLRRALAYTAATYLTSGKEDGHMLPYDERNTGVKLLSEIYDEDSRVSTVIVNTTIGQMQTGKAANAAGISKRGYNYLIRRRKNAKTEPIIS